MSFSHSSGVHISGGTFYAAGGDVNIQNNRQLAIQSTAILGNLGSPTTFSRLGSDGAPDIPTPSLLGPDRNHRNIAGSERPRLLPYDTATRRPPSSQISVPPDTSRSQYRTTSMRSDSLPTSPSVPGHSGYSRHVSRPLAVLPAPADYAPHHQPSTIISGGLFVTGNVNNIQTNVAGKSAIAQTFAGMCQQEDRLGGSFFFKRGHEQRGTCDGLFATLAFQLTRFSSDLNAAIQQVVEADTLLVGRALAVQLQELFVSVFKRIPPPHPFPVIVIDGLDECRDHRIQTHLLQILIGAIQEHQLPIRILILELRADKSSYDDIGTYFCAEFARIRDKFARIPRDHSPSRSRTLLDDSWPSQAELYHLVRKSSGVFIYASTVVRFVDDKCSHSQDRLKSVLQLDPDSTAPLDDLYTEILSSVSNHPTLLRVLHAAFRFKLFPGPHEIDLLLDLPPGTARLTLHGLQSIIRIPSALTRISKRQGVEVLHESLRDYFLDPDRSRSWCLWTHVLDSALAHHVVRCLVSPLKEGNFPELINFYYEILCYVLSYRSEILTPNQVFDFLRNQHVEPLWFVDYFTFTSTLVRKCLKRFPSIPADLSKTLTDSDFIRRFLSDLKPRSERLASHPTCRLDSIYMDIFSANPLLLHVLHIQLIDGPVLLGFNVLALGCTYTVFRPLCVFDGLINGSFPEGESPLDFLSDPRRARNLYEEQRLTAEKVIIRWIRLVKQFLAGDDFYRYDLSSIYLLELLRKCVPSPVLLHEIETFDMAALFPLFAENVDGADPTLREFLGVQYFDAVIDWLHLFPNQPIEAIQFWERQRSDACRFWDWLESILEIPQQDAERTK
ncbi:hypothetical protein C8R44DRAFT_978009 [Mycena epipterygia]|nr:hypothetical protein C8R44DRAFT_978009 [Mycena epipterygia]